eukprot:TRINITY_DN554_c0_g1_i2.p1 TRINITY_DN554_c0_g1~~TRINITY_DN554_c0_g1_i2.p1  ORF type:complete len:373 (-),score=79.02 TRINITY_DN554_c0_g1_i2:153-1271(-)
MALRSENPRVGVIPGGKLAGNVKPAARRAVFQTITNKPIAPLPKDVVRKPREAKLTARRQLRVDPEPMEIAEEDYMDIVGRREEESRVKLPEGVPDIDQVDLNNPQLCSEYTKEMYAYLREQEGKYNVRANYLSEAGCPTSGKMRTVLVDWLVDVQQQFKLLQETLYLTISIIDRFLSREGKSIPRTQLQLVGISAMFIASKVEEIYAPELNDFVYITDNAYDASEVRAMELRIFKALDFNVGDPLSINFLRRFSKAGDVDLTQHALAKYILETILLDYALVSLPPSLCAATALYLSLGILEGEDSDIWPPSLQHYTGYSRAQVHAKAKGVAQGLKKAHEGKFTAIKVKYSSKQMQKIALNSDISDKLQMLE